MQRKIYLLVCLLASIFVSCGGDDTENPNPLELPQGVVLSQKTLTSLTFSWNAVEGATGYVCKLLNSKTNAVAEIESSTASITFTNLEENNTYRFAVKAYRNTLEDATAYTAYVDGVTDSQPAPSITDFGFPAWENDALVRAFPGAEGGGMFTTGGRGGKVIRVTNLNDSGTGSLRAAINASGARTIVFDVDGVIALQSTLEIKNGDLTIAGQTAPGDGICLKNYSLVVKANNVIIRFIRSRMGDEKATADDAMWGRYQKNIIIDHCSMSWSTDECSSFYANENFTMQWCVLAESLRMSVHEKGTHGYGAIWGGVNASFHHNLLAHHESRNPRFDGGDVYEIAANPLRNADRSVDFRNCVVYNFSNYPAYGGEGQKVNFTGNYYKWGPGSIYGPNVGDTKGKQRKYFYLVQGVKEQNGVPVDFGCPHIYMGANTNYFYTTEPFATLNSDNWAGGIAYDKPENVGSTTYTKLTSPIAIKPGGVTAKITNHIAEKAYEAVLDYAGARWAKSETTTTRDAVDARAVSDTRTGTATYMTGGNGSANGYIDTQTAVGGWPVYATGTAATDTDGDGIPDTWEDATGLDKNSANDGVTKTLDPSGRYTNLEVYLHWLVKDVVEGQVVNGNYIDLN